MLSIVIIFMRFQKWGDLGRNLGAKSVYFTLVDAMPDTKNLLLDSSQKIKALEQVNQIEGTVLHAKPRNYMG